MHDSYIAQDHLLLALLKDPGIAAILKEAQLTEASLKTAIEQVGYIRKSNYGDTNSSLLDPREQKGRIQDGGAGL